MIAPPPRFSMIGAAIQVPMITAVRSISITRRHCVSDACGYPGIPVPMPALLYKMSRPPNFSTAVSIILRASASWVTSALTNVARPPALSVCFAVSAPPAVSTSATTIEAPSCARRIEVARPIPDPAPVMTATFPRISILLSEGYRARLTNVAQHDADQQSDQHVGRESDVSVVAFFQKEQETKCHPSKRHQRQHQQADGHNRMRVAAD